MRFPAERKLWRAFRGFDAFERLHAALSAQFADAMRARQIHLPRPARLSWESTFRFKSSHSPASGSLPPPPRLERLRPQLNAYLHKLLEIDAVHASRAFRQFLTPVVGSMDVELTGKAVPEQLGAPLSKCLSQPALLPSIPAAVNATSNAPTPSTAMATGAGKRALTRLKNMRKPAKKHVPQSPAIATAASPSETEGPVDSHSGESATVLAKRSQCGRALHYGGKIELTALGGLGVGLTKRSALSGSQKAVAMAAAGVAGMALTGPLSAVLAIGALGSGVGKYQLNKAHYLTLENPSQRTASHHKNHRRRHNGHDHGDLKAGDAGSSAGSGGHSFLIETAEQFSGPRRPVKFGDAIHLYCQRIRKSVRVAAPADSKRGHLMVTGAESHKATTLRLVSPYGHSGAIRCGSHVLLEITDGEFADELVGLHGDLLATGASPVVFHLRSSSASDHSLSCPEAHHHHARRHAPRPGHRHVHRHYQSSSSTASSSSPSPLSSLATVSLISPQLSSSQTSPVSTAQALSSSPSPDATPFSLRVMTYNVWLLPSIVSSFSDKLSPSALLRAQAIPSCLAPLALDIVVFCEAFDSAARELLVAGMKAQGFLYETRAIGAGASFLSSKKAIDSGCFAMSRFPIYAFQERTFGSVAAGDDRMADKGVLYFQVRVPTCDGDGQEYQSVHVVGTHLQAWETPSAVATRANQLQLVREFVDALELPRDEPVIITGDMNVNNCAGGDASEYKAMLDVLDVVDPPLTGESSAFSFDPLTNALAVDGPSSGGETERLDYVMLRRAHRQPVDASARVVQLKATSDWQPPAPSSAAQESDEQFVDLSDHYPVLAEFQF